MCCLLGNLLLVWPVIRDKLDIDNKSGHFKSASKLATKDVDVTFSLYKYKMKVLQVVSWQNRK